MSALTKALKSRMDEIGIIPEDRAEFLECLEFGETVVITRLTDDPGGYILETTTEEGA